MVVQERPSEQGAAAAAAGSAQPAGPDYSGAYSAAGQPLPLHQQWCSVCAIVGVRTPPTLSVIGPHGCNLHQCARCPLWSASMGMPVRHSSCQPQA
jgi:hypothetical protein